MKKRIFVLALMILNLVILSGCSSIKKNDDTIVNITILNTKVEIQSTMADAINEFTEKNPDIKIKLITRTNDEGYYEKLLSMYENGNPPTISLIDSADVPNFKDKLLTLSSEEWVNNISGEISNLAKNDNGEIVAFPFSLEGAGFIYNKKIIQNAGIDVSKLNTISALKEAFQKVSDLNKKALIITNEDWSLSNHFLGTAYSAQSNDVVEVANYIENLKNGKVDLQNDSKVNGLLNTFDLMKEYNIYKDAPLMPSYNECIEVFAKGDTAFWYMGNWVSTSILKNNNEFGFVPVPISDNSSDYGNNELALGVTKYLVVDKINSSEKQEEAAKKFLNWLVYDEAGQDFMVTRSGLITAFDNNEIKSQDPLYNDLVDYKNDGETMELALGYLPSNSSTSLGSALRKYLNNEINRTELLDILKKSWTELK